MRLLWAASRRHLYRHPAQLALALAGLTLGVGTIVAVDIATASARRAFELSVEAVDGPATHQIVGAGAGLDERLYVRLRTDAQLAAAGAQFAPVVSGYVRIGDRLLELYGTDPFAALGTQAPGGLRAPAQEARAWLTQAGTVILSAASAAQLHLESGARFTLGVGGVRHEARLIATAGGSAALDTLVLTDIAQAQEWLGARGQLTRIDARLPPGAAGAACAARLRALLPPGAELLTTRARARETFAMTDAFTTNLRAMSLLALLVGTFLIYGAVSFAVVQRRALLGVLRALGATRAQTVGMLLAEAALLGLAGSVLGAIAGLGIARALVALVSRTINDLYFVVAVNALAVPAGSLVLALAAGLGTALLAALVPALEAAGGPPRLALARSVLEARAQRASRALLTVAFGCGALAAILVFASARSLLAGFAALFLVLLAVAAATPAALRALAHGAARLARQPSTLLRLALEDVARSLSRTGVAVAALGMALTAMIGVAVMVESFRSSLRDWLGETLRADVYVSAPGPTDDVARRLDAAVIERVLALPAVAAVSRVRHVSVGSPAGAIDLNAIGFGPHGERAFRLTQGSAAQAWPAFAQGAVLVSEPLAWRLRLRLSDRLDLDTPAGPVAFPIAGVYREYGNDRGEILMSLPVYQRDFGDRTLSGLGLYLVPGSDPASVVRALRAATADTQLLFIRSNAELRALSMGIFERTFVITRVLYWLAAGVAALGLVSALLAWELERSGELALLRALGLTPRGSGALILAQTLFMGAAAFLVAVPAGLMTALVLTEVINRRAFGWQIDLHLAPAQFGNALAIALAAALAAALYPAWRQVRAPLTAALRAE